MHDHYTHSGDGFILVFALNDPQSFHNISRYREKICRAKDSLDVSLFKSPIIRVIFRYRLF
jgi:hypothetical protein